MAPLTHEQGRAECVACGAERTGNLAVCITALDDEASEVEGVHHLLAGFLDGHALLLAQFVEQLCVLLGLLAGGRVDDGGLADVGELEFLGERVYLVWIADEDDFGQLVGQCLVGSGKRALFKAFG